jgi:hypothetical protein
MSRDRLRVFVLWLNAALLAPPAFLWLIVAQMPSSMVSPAARTLVLLWGAWCLLWSVLFSVAAMAGEGRARPHS